jgi:hypothetical protein
MVRYRRGLQFRYWEVELKTPKGLAWVSTRELDLTRATYAALPAKERTLARFKASGPPAVREAKISTTPKFADAAAAFMDELNKRESGIRQEMDGLPANLLLKRLSKLRLHRRRVESVLNPTFGHLKYDDITQSLVFQFLSGLQVKGRLPRQSTIGNYAHTYSMIMDRFKAISNATREYPRISRKGFDHAVARPTFETSELTEVVGAMTDEWVQAPRQDRHRMSRYLLRAYVHICATTGIRPGLEMDRLTFDAIQDRTHADTGERYTAISIRKGQGKHLKEREAVVYQNDGAADFYFAMRELTAFRGHFPAPTGLLFIHPIDGKIPMFSKLFKNLMTKSILDKNLFNQHKSLYSLRHYYANSQIEKGINIYDLAQIMGTSTGMIERYYGKAISRRKQAKISGILDDLRSRNEAKLATWSLQNPTEINFNQDRVRPNWMR